jgi:integrase
MTSPKHEPLVLSAEEREVLVGGRGRDAGLHFHDLRHTGNNLAGGKGASLREPARAEARQFLSAILGGHGLLIVAQLTSNWGRTGDSAAGWTVWFEIDIS